MSLRQVLVPWISYCTARASLSGMDESGDQRRCLGGEDAPSSLSGRSGSIADGRPRPIMSAVPEEMMSAMPLRVRMPPVSMIAIGPATAFACSPNSAKKACTVSAAVT